MRISDWSSDVCSSDLPAIPVRLHKQATFRKPAKVDRREAELIRKRPDFLGSSLVIARQENDSPAPMCHRVLVEDGSDQMVEARSEERRVGKSVSVSVDLGGRRIIKKKTLN